MATTQSVDASVALATAYMAHGDHSGLNANAEHAASMGKAVGVLYTEIYNAVVAAHKTE